MNQSDAKQGNTRASRIEGFLREALAGGEETVIALQEKARAAGLLGERQCGRSARPVREAYLSAVIVRRSGARRTISLRI
jgi:hypothetical protein